MVKPIFVTVDGARPESAHVTSEAPSQLFHLHPRFDKRPMDGIATNIEGDLRRTDRRTAD